MSTPTRPVAVVTGASSGIGAASARRLAADGFQVVVGARRKDRLDELAKELDGVAVSLDVTDDTSVGALAEAVAALPGPLKVLVNNAGGAKGQEPIGAAQATDWQWMYEVNVLGTLRVTKALLPALEASGAGHVVLMSSTAGHGVYEGGAGYTGVKHAINAFAETLRLEVNGKPIRVTEIAPGMVKTDEFSLVRFDGDQARADAVYAGVPAPLTADDIADCVSWVVTRPAHVDIDLLVVRPVAQASNYKVHRVK
jgi:NADP-dependent 3-hydroxy acid dehydrogenase YdfG